MNIWMINHYAAPATRAACTRHAVLSKHLKSQGNEVTVFASNGNHTGGRRCTGVEIPAGHSYLDEVVAGVRWRYVPTTPYENSAQRFFNMRSFRQNLCRNIDDLPDPDVVIGSCVHPYAVDGAIRLARKFDVPFVYEIRDIWPESLVDIGALSKWHPVYWELRRLELKAFRHAAGVIVLFPGMGRYLRRYGIGEESTCFVPNGVDGISSPVIPTRNSDNFTLTYYGAHGPVNGLKTILDAAARLRRIPSASDIRLRLIGDGVEKPALQRYSDTLGLANVEFLDSVPKSDLPRYVEDTSAFIYCQSRMPVIEKYGFSPNKLSEYMMYNRPLVFSCKSYNNPVEEARAGLSVEPENPQALADAILQMRASSEQQRWTMACNARRFALQHHDLSKLSRRLGKFLERTVQGSRAPGELSQIA